MRSLDDFACVKLKALERARLRRSPVVTARDGIFVERGGRRLLSFSCNDYLNLSRHPAVIKAAVAATGRYGVGAGASRLVTGNHPLYEELESALARFKGTEAACVFGSGYLANIGIIPALVGSGDLIVLDELCHACINAGAKLSGATVLRYRHCDVGHAEALLVEHRGAHDRALIATDGVFSMDGDMAPLKALSALGDRHNAWLLVDDAHGLGVVGGGRGAAFADAADVPLQMGTLSKAVGAYGGYLAASRVVIDLMRTRARSFIYSTGLPPQMADQGRRHKSLADVGASCGDEDGAHVASSITRLRTMPASRSISASGWAAVKAKRKRAVLSGTVGGRIGTTRKPSSSNIVEAVSAASASPTIAGTMALCASGRLSARVNSRALRNGAAVNAASRSIRLSAAMAAATTGGGRPVE